MRVEFDEIVPESGPKPKYEFRLRFVTEIVLNEYDIWQGLFQEFSDNPPQRVTLKSVVEHLRDRFDDANQIIDALIDNYDATELKTTLDVSIEEGTRVVELVGGSNDDEET